MTEWDPYYLARGLYRPLAEDETKDGLARRRQDDLAARNERQEQERTQQLDSFAAVVASTVEQRQMDLKRRLDDLAASNSAALMENAEALAEIRHRVQALLNRAYLHEDGRRLFRTVDGTRVIDEHGQDVTEEIDPDLIEPFRPTWEEFAQEQAEQDALEQERQDLLERQDRLDQLDQHLAADDLSAEDLNAIDAELGALEGLLLPGAQLTASHENQMPDNPGRQPALTSRDVGPGF